MEDVQRLYMGFTMADWGYELKRACEGDLYDSSTLLLRTITLIFSLPRITHFFIKWIMSLVTKISFPGNNRRKNSCDSKMIWLTLTIVVPTVTGYGNMAAYKETMELIQRYHEDMDQMGLDAILTFASYHPAPLKVIRPKTYICCGCSLKNLYLRFAGNPRGNVPNSGLHRLELVRHARGYRARVKSHRGRRSQP